MGPLQGGNGHRVRGEMVQDKNCGSGKFVLYLYVNSTNKKRQESDRGGMCMRDLVFRVLSFLTSHKTSDYIGFMDLITDSVPLMSYL